MSEPRRRANTELGLLLLGLIATGVGGVLLELSQSPELPPEALVYLAPLPALALVAHLVKRWLAPASDPIVLPAATLLNGLGLVMMRRIDFAAAAGNPEAAQLAPTQAVWTTIAILAFVGILVALRDHVNLDRYRYVIGLGAVLLLLTPMLPVIGREVNGARIWLQIGPMTIQPVEIAKLGLVIFFASYLGEKRDLLSFATHRIGPVMVPPARAFAPLLLIWALGIAVQGLQNDLGPSLLFFGVFIVMLYVATARAVYPVASLGLAALGGWFAYTQFSHVASRVAIWLDPWAEYEDAGFQLAQSLFAFGTGGITGVGLGQGQPNLIPFVRTDFVLAAVGEELGLLGATAVLLCFLLLVGRGFRIAVTARDEVGTLLAVGLTTILALQVFIIIGGATRLIPLTGITLPFVSYGGSSLLANWMLVALLVRVSSPIAPRRRRHPKDEPGPGEHPAAPDQAPDADATVTSDAVRASARPASGDSDQDDEWGPSERGRGR